MTKIFLQKYSHRNKNTRPKLISGFTLVETLVAISILTVAMVGTLTAIQSGLKDTTIAKDQIIAFYLAQEGMEFVRNIIDENILHSLGGSSTDWLASLSSISTDACYFGKTCRIDSNAKTIVNCASGAGSCPVLNIDSVSGLYGYTSAWPGSTFKREIQFQSVSANEVLAIITISWTNRGTPQSFQVSELFFNR